MKGSRGKKLNRSYRLLAIIFIAILAVLFLANIIKGSRLNSELENRRLAQRPAVTGRTLVNGTYAEEFEEFETDQFPARNMLRRIYMGFERFGGTKEENGIIRGKRQQLMEDIVTPDSLILNQKTSGINNYAVAHPDVSTHILLVPDAAAILDERLPAFAETADQSRLFLAVKGGLDDSIIWMDGISAMENHTNEKIYYQTDRYWTTEGAYQVFLETASGLGITDPYEVTYESYCAAYDFNGELAATSGFMLGRKEEIYVYLPDVNTSYLVTYTDTGVTTPSLYSVDALDTRDKYDVFLDGDHPLVEIDTGAESSRVLLVVKDSFANCYIPFLIPYFNRIIVVDPVYCDEGIEELSAAYNVTDTLFLYGGNDFFEDSALPWFLDSPVAAEEED